MKATLMRLKKIAKKLKKFQIGVDRVNNSCYNEYRRLREIINN